MSLKNVIYGNVLEEKEIRIFITERETHVDFLVQEQGKQPDKKLEHEIWEAVKGVIGNRYGIKEWQTKRID